MPPKCKPHQAWAAHYTTAPVARELPPDKQMKRYFHHHKPATPGTCPVSG